MLLLFLHTFSPFVDGRQADTFRGTLFFAIVSMKSDYELCIYIAIEGCKGVCVRAREFTGMIESTQDEDGRCRSSRIVDNCRSLHDSEI